MEIAKSGGFNCPQLAAIGWNISFIDTPWLAAGTFFRSRINPGRQGVGVFDYFDADLVVFGLYARQFLPCMARRTSTMGSRRLLNPMARHP